MIAPALAASALLAALPSARLQDSGQGGGAKHDSLVKLPDDFVQFARVPEAGLYPRVGIGQGELAVLWYQGGGAAGDLFLARSRDEARTFSPARRVNAVPASVACDGGAHAGAIDLGPDGSAHVAWTTAGEARSLLYARVPADSDPLPPVELGAPLGLCFSVAVTVDARGRVFVFYASASGPEDLESVPPGRRIWMRTSTDGLAFTEPVTIDREHTGVSEHSGIAAHVDEIMGTVFVLYRTAYALKPDSASLARGMRLGSSEDGETFRSVWVDNWKAVRDPRSSAVLGQEDNSTLAIWDAGGEVFWSVIRRQVKKVNLPMQPRSEGPPVLRTRPTGAAGEGEVFLAWLERPKDAPRTPPRVGWRVWLREGRAPLGGGFAPEALQAGTPVALARSAGGFTLLY
jgi:hypothetical protein